MALSSRVLALHARSLVRAMSTEAPVVAQRAPFAVDVVAGGKAVFWSKKQPLCDGSHKGSSFKPVKFEPSETKTLYLCGCKHTKSAPLCDGSHNKLA